MRTFQDCEGREWKLSVNLGSARRVKEQYGIDLLGFDERLIGRLSSEMVLMADVVFLLIEQQAKGRDIDREAFFDALDGTALESAKDALIDATVDYLPAGRQEKVRKALAKIKELDDRLIAEAEKRLNDPNFIDGVIAELQSKLLGPAKQPTA